MRGVRQGGPMLFILAIDPLQRILDAATQQGVLTPLPLASMRLRMSLYADDAAIFVNPRHEDIPELKTIFETVGTVSGSITNFDKSSIHPIRFEDFDLQHILQAFQGAQKGFTCRYLGLQLTFLHYKKSMCNHSSKKKSTNDFSDGKEDYLIVLGDTPL